MQLSIDVSDPEEDGSQNEEEEQNSEFEEFKPTENLADELRTPKIENDDDFAAQVNAGLEHQTQVLSQKEENVLGDLDSF